MMKNFLNSNSSSGSTSENSNESPCARITPTPPKGDPRSKGMEDPHAMGRPRSMSQGNQKSPGSPYPQVPQSHNGGTMPPHREVSSSGGSSHGPMPPHLEREGRSRQPGNIPNPNPITDYWKRQRALAQQQVIYNATPTKIFQNYFGKNNFGIFF